jgi:glycosyltransferase involved in cell wall biosynthesis
VPTTPFLSLIIPAFNEEKRLPGTLQQVAHFLAAQNYSSEVLVIENGSQDATYEIAGEFAEKNKTFAVHHTDQRGKGLAVRTGMLAARGEYRMMLDADLSMPIEQIERFVPFMLKGTDIIIASREAPGAVRYNEPPYRHWGGRAINLMIRLLALPGLQDTQCGFKCFKAAVAEDLFGKQTLNGWGFDIEVLYVAKQRGYSIVELPIPWYYREQSHVHPIPDTLRMFFDILRIRRNAALGIYG